MRKITAVIMTCSMLMLVGCGTTTEQTVTTEQPVKTKVPVDTEMPTSTPKPTPIPVPSKKVKSSKSSYQFEREKNVYQYRNSTNLYVTEYEGKKQSLIIQQRDLKGNYVKKLIPEEHKEAKDIVLRCVDDEWIYYTRAKKWHDSGRTELWRAPIRKTSKGDDVQLQEEELVVVADSGICGEIYVKGNYVYYNEDMDLVCDLFSGRFRKYDMKNKRHVEFSQEVLKQGKYRNTGWATGTDDVMLLVDYGEVEDDVSSAKEPECGVYIQEVSGNSFHKITQTIPEFVLNGNQMIYGEREGKSAAQTILCRYDLNTHASEVLFTQKELMEIVKCVGKFKGNVVIRRVARDDKKIYILVEAKKSKQIKSLVLLSCKMNGKPTLKLEANWYNYYRNRYIDEWDAETMWFVDGQVLWLDEREDVIECFNLKTGEVKEIKRKDEEYWWQYWN